MDSLTFMSGVKCWRACYGAPPFAGDPSGCSRPKPGQRMVEIPRNQVQISPLLSLTNMFYQKSSKSIQKVVWGGVLDSEPSKLHVWRQSRGSRRGGRGQSRRGGAGRGRIQSLFFSWDVTSLSQAALVPHQHEEGLGAAHQALLQREGPTGFQAFTRPPCFGARIAGLLGLMVRERPLINFHY